MDMTIANGYDIIDIKIIKNNNFEIKVMGMNCREKLCSKALKLTKLGKEILRRTNTHKASKKVQENTIRLYSSCKL